MAGLHATPTAPPMAKACRTILDFVSWLSHGAEVHGGLTLNTWVRHFFTCVSPFLLLMLFIIERDWSRAW